MVQISRCQQHSTDHSHRETEDKSESTSVRNLFFGPLLFWGVSKKSCCGLALWNKPSLTAANAHIAAGHQRPMGCSAAAMPGTGLRACWKDSRFGKIHNTADLERYTSFCFVLFCSSPFPQPHCKTWSSRVCISHNLEEELSMFTASFCSASSYWRTRFCPRSCSVWEIQHMGCWILCHKTPLPPPSSVRPSHPAELGLSTWQPCAHQLPSAHIMSEVSCTDKAQACASAATFVCLVWCQWIEKKKSLTPKKAGDKMVKNESPPVASVTKMAAFTD